MMSQVLFVTNKADLTTDFVVREIQKKGVRFYRLNTEEIGLSVLLSLDFKGRYYLYDQLSGEKHDLESFSAVYFRRPSIREYHEEDLTEAEIQFLRIEQYQSLEGIYRILDGAFWISPLNAIRNAENKIYQQILASKIGLLPTIRKISGISGIVTKKTASSSQLEAGRLGRIKLKRSHIPVSWWICRQMSR